MFNNKRYMTREVSETLGLELQLILWGLIDSLMASGQEVDYLQVFECKLVKDARGRKIQAITHRQEVPEYSRTHYYLVDRPINGKLFAIDSNGYSTLMFDREY